LIQPVVDFAIVSAVVRGESVTDLVYIPIFTYITQSPNGVIWRFGERNAGLSIALVIW